MLPLAAKLLCYLSSSTPVATSMIQFCVYLIHWRKLSACDDASGTSLEKKSLENSHTASFQTFLWLFSWRGGRPGFSGLDYYPLIVETNASAVAY